MHAHTRIDADWKCRIQLIPYEKSSSPLLKHEDEVNNEICRYVLARHVFLGIILIAFSYKTCASMAYELKRRKFRLKMHFCNGLFVIMNEPTPRSRTRQMHHFYSSHPHHLTCCVAATDYLIIWSSVIAQVSQSTRMVNHGQR